MSAAPGSAMCQLSNPVHHEMVRPAARRPMTVLAERLAGGPAAEGFNARHRQEVRAALEVAAGHDPRSGLDLAGWLQARWYGGIVLGDGGCTTAIATAPDGIQRPRRGAQPSDRFSAVTSPEAHDLRARRRGGVAEGWWRTWGEPQLARASDAISRIYLAPRPDSVTLVVRSVTAALAGTGLSWTLKVDDPAVPLPQAVVQLPDDALDTALELLLPALDGLLYPHTPPLTCQVTAGLAWSEDPGDGHTFGAHRCRVIGDAVTAATAQATAADVAVAFRRNGLDPRAPHLRATDHGARHAARPRPDRRRC